MENTFLSLWQAPFNQWHLREDYKRVNRRKELAESLRTHILILGCINLVLMPVILLWQVLYSFYNYAQIIKSEPGSLGIRKWSLYGRYYLRSDYLGINNKANVIVQTIADISMNSSMS